MILKRRKRFELRRIRGGLRIRPGDLVVLYFSGSERGVMGTFRVGRVFEGTRDELRRIAEKLRNTGLTEQMWSYVDSERPGLMIEVLKPRRVRKIGLDELREKVKGFRPPQSYRVLRPDEPLYRFLKKRRIL